MLAIALIKENYALATIEDSIWGSYSYLFGVFLNGKINKTTLGNIWYPCKIIISQGGWTFSEEPSNKIGTPNQRLTIFATDK